MRDHRTAYAVRSSVRDAAREPQNCGEQRMTPVRKVSKPEMHTAEENCRDQYSENWRTPFVQQRALNHTSKEKFLCQGDYPKSAAEPSEGDSRDAPPPAMHRCEFDHMKL